MDGYTKSVINKELFQSKFTDLIFKIMLESKQEHIPGVCEVYNCSLEEFKETVQNELSTSNLNTGACNTALDFLIIETEQGKVYRDLRDGIRSCILNSAIYWENGAGVNSLYSEI